MADVPYELRECQPETADGVRHLAYIALQTEMFDVRRYIDNLELRMLEVLRIKPEGVGRDDEDEVKPVEIEHIRRRGLRVRWSWQHWLKCDACDGKGTLRASGYNGQDYRVDCPECCGCGKVEGDQEDILTDIDGNLWRKAA